MLLRVKPIKPHRVAKCEKHDQHASLVSTATGDWHVLQLPDETCLQQSDEHRQQPTQ